MRHSVGRRAELAAAIVGGMSSTVLALVVSAAIVVVIAAVVGGLCLAYLHEDRVRGTRSGRVLFRVLDAISRTLDRIPWF